MIQTPVCPFETIFSIFTGDTEITVIRLNDGKQLYAGVLSKSLGTLSEDYKSLVVAYSGVYNNRTTGAIEICVWDLTILEDPDL